MAVTLNFAPEVEQRLRKRAAQTGLSLEAYLEFLVTHELPPLTDDAPSPPGDLEAWFKELAEGSENMPTLPPHMTRDDFYEDD